MEIEGIDCPNVDACGIKKPINIISRIPINKGLRLVIDLL